MRQVLRDIFATAVRRALPARCLPAHLPTRPVGRTIVVGAGKASAAMAAALEQHWDGEIEGLVVTRYGHAAPCERIEVVEAAHPVPDAAGAQAAGRILQMMDGLSRDDLVVALISGGASALLALPGAGITLQEKQEINRSLLRSGAAISEMNCVRKHLSAIKGGRLARAAAPARMTTLLISDVPGDDPAVIGSGPTVGDPTTHGDARAILDRYGIAVSNAIGAHLATAAETPKPDDRCFEGAHVAIIASPMDALRAGARCAAEQRLGAIILGDALEGRAHALGREHAALARARQGQRPMALLSGGETTVHVRGAGRGGRNTEYLLALAIALDGAPGIWALAGDTDGIDGTEDNAGAIVTPDTLARAAAQRIDPVAYLADNDAYGFFARLGDLVVTGPTLTNVNDFRVIVMV